MDIDLFSEMVKDLILDNDEVTLPGLGTFVSEVMPSSFSDKGYTINPPYRRLSFRQRGSDDDSLLVDFYSKANGTAPETSRRILSDFISGLRNTLQTKKIVVFPGLGRLRATKENTFFFIADEDLDIYPYGVGLESVSLKTHEETPDEVAQSVAALRELVNESAPSVTEPVEVTDGDVAESAASVTEPVEGIEDDVMEESLRQAQRPDWESRRPEEESQRPEQEFQRPEDEDQMQDGIDDAGRKKGRHGWRMVAIVAASIVGLAALALGIFLFLAHVAPDFIDSILYTPEELKVINY